MALRTGPGKPWVCSGLLAGLLLGCAASPSTPEEKAAQKSCMERTDPGALIHAHAHNDYEHDAPLQEALAQRFYSVEADVFLAEGVVMVGHYSTALKGSLKELYLDPLQARIDEKQSAHGDGVRFTLWIDFKEDSQAIQDALADLLAQYEMLSVFGQEGAKDNAVLVVLTGAQAAKEAFVAAPTRRAQRDSNHHAPADPPADDKWTHYALKWGTYVDWNGWGEPSDEVRDAMKDLVDDIHAKGRKVRFYAAPDREESWQLQLEVGVDFINTDRLDDLSPFLCGKNP
jgi:hypothetical protein